MMNKQKTKKKPLHIYKYYKCSFTWTIGIIISERYLPVEQKTIKPLDIGGIAGGEKFIVQGILYVMHPAMILFHADFLSILSCSSLDKLQVRVRYRACAWSMDVWRGLSG